MSAKQSETDLAEMERMLAGAYPLTLAQGRSLIAEVKRLRADLTRSAMREVTRRLYLLPDGSTLGSWIDASDRACVAERAVSAQGARESSGVMCTPDDAAQFGEINRRVLERGGRFPVMFKPLNQPRAGCDMEIGPCSCGAWHEYSSDAGRSTPMEDE